MIICDQPALFAQCCQRTSHVISLAKSSIKSGQRRSGPSNLSTKARQNFFPYWTRDKSRTASQRGKKIPPAIFSKLYITSVHNRNFHLSGAECAWKSQSSPWRHSSSHLLSLPKSLCHPEGTWCFWFWSKELLGGTTPLAKNTQLPHLAWGVSSFLGMFFSFDFMTVWLHHGETPFRLMCLSLFLEAWKPEHREKDVEAGSWVESKQNLNRATYSRLGNNSPVFQLVYP